MRQNPGRRIRFLPAVIIAFCVLVAAAVGAVIAWPESPHPALPLASCGRVITHQLNADTQAFTGSDVLTCFTTAARGCKAASIGVTEMGVDAGTGYVFTIGHNGPPCQVTELSQDYSANFGGSVGPITSAACRMAAVTGNGVVLNCGGQDILIPASVSEP